MFGRISNGWSMARSSWRILMADKKLLLFPIISGLLYIIVLASFWIPTAMLVDLEAIAERDANPPFWFYFILLGSYFSTYFVIIFCNAALVSCTILKFNGQEATLRDGFRMAMARLPQIAGWALLSGTVGLILKVIENAHEKAGYLISSILGTAWSAMTYFVVPILVVEKLGPIASVSRSTSILKKTWGEALTGQIGLGLFLLFFALVLFVPLGLIVFLVAAQNSTQLLLIAIAFVAVAIMLYSAIASALHTLFIAAVYQFAVHDRAPEGFDEYQLRTAFAASK